MRVIVAALALGLLVGPAEAQLRITPSEPAVSDQSKPAVSDQNDESLRRCILSVLRSKDGQIDKKRVVDEVVSDCFSIMDIPNDVLLGPKQEMHAWIDAQMARDRREVSALVEKLAPRAKAEKADEDQVGANYFLCLRRHAQVFALATNESADIVAQASLSACPAERAAVVEVNRHYNDVLSEGAMKMMDNRFAQQLLLEIVQIRAQRNIAPTPTPEPQPHKTPI